MKAFLFCFCLLSCMQSYTQQTPSNTFPLPVRGGTLIYHAPSKALLLVGALPIIPDTAKSDVWKLDGKTWTQIKASGPGSVDFSQGIALNSNTGLIFSFGGYDMFDDTQKYTWTFNGKTWSKLPAQSMSGRIHHSIVYADHLNAFVMYGGFDENREEDTLTWLMNDGKFTALKIPGPGTRHQFAMAYDKYRKKVVLYGGSERSNEHWEFDGTNWKKYPEQYGPGNQVRHKMFYHDGLKMVMLHGGDPRGSAQTTWGWNGSAWKKIAEGPFIADALGYDEKRKVVVAYGSTENAHLGLWELKDSSWTKVADYGKWDIDTYRAKWQSENPSAVELLINEGFNDLFFKKFPEAEVVYKKIERVFPDKPIVLINLTYALLMQGKLEETKTYLSKINQHSHLFSRAMLARLGSYLIGTKQYTEGIAYLEKALAMKPMGADFYNLACAYALSNKPDQAFEALNKAVENGFKGIEQFEKDSDLDSLKADARWRTLLEKLQ